MAVFTNKKFIEKLIWLVNDVPNKYYSKSGTWCTMDNGKWRMDCVVSIKGILWGFTGDKNKTHGGAVYGSNGVKDFTCNGGLNYCTEVSQDFSNITTGEYLCMKGTMYNHSGIYLGNGKVFECTTGWNKNKCIISDIDKKGTRSLNGSKSLKWTYHGKLKYITYLTEEETKVEYKIGDTVEINGVYISSTSKARLKPLIKKGKITRIIKGANNPYLLNNGLIGWVNDTVITRKL